MGLRGILAGALALVALQTLVRTSASNRVAGLLGVPAAVAARFIDPRLPAIPERKAPAAAEAPASSDPWAPPKNTAGLPRNPVPTTTGGD